ncbi:MAG TPA: hypothetical protein VM077_05745 [Candidatus Limnocylindrales bacterium]|nr:hypothetical protein [Candidatus Limnocylindrales bacterium]
MGEREGPRSPRRKKHRLRAGLTAGAILVAGAAAARHLPDNANADVYYSRSASPSTTRRVIFEPVKVIPDDIPPQGNEIPPKTVEIGKKTEYTNVKGTFVSVDKRPYITFVVIKQESGDFLRLNFWDENTKSNNNPTAKYRNGSHGFKRGQQVIVEVPTGKLSQKDKNAYEKNMLEQGCTPEETQNLIARTPYSNRIVLVEYPKYEFRTEDEYLTINSRGIKPNSRSNR